MSLSPSTTSTRKCIACFALEIADSVCAVLSLHNVVGDTFVFSETFLIIMQKVCLFVCGTQQVLEEKPCQGTLCLQGAGSHG